MRENQQIDSSNYAIEVFNLCKTYKIKGKNNKITALNNINLKVKEGEIFGLLGPNGAGKTTLVSILTTLIKPTSGSAIVLGHDILKNPWFVKNNTGLMLGESMVYYRITGYKNLKFFCKIYGISDFKTKIDQIAETLKLSQWLNQLVEKYSTGMKVKLALARVLLIEPKILFLDEPMIGLDPIIVNELITLLKDLKATIFLTSHQMDIVQKLCNRVAFLNKGEIVKVDTQENFKKILKRKINLSVELNEKKEIFIENLKKLDYIEEINLHEKNILFSINNESDFPKLFNFLKDYSIIRFNEIESTLNDIFIRLVV